MLSTLHGIDIAPKLFRFSKVDSPMLLMFFPSSISFNDVQPLKMGWRIVIPSPIFTFFKLVHSSNKEFPIDITLLGMTISDILAQPWNADDSIVETEIGMVILSSFLQFRKHEYLIDSRLSGKLKLTKLEQFANACEPISLIPPLYATSDKFSQLAKALYGIE